MVKAGMTMPLLKEQFGHKSIMTTMKYAGFHPDYHDVSPHFARVAEVYGFSSGNSSGNTTSVAEES